jgi:putative hydrolase of the HAD superfamily
VDGARVLHDRAMAVLFDFFGTLVDYSPSRTEQGYPRSTAVLARLGCRLGYDEWLATWSASSERLYAESVVTGVEFSMHDAFAAFAREAGLDDCPPQGADAFVEAYLAEWSTAVRLIDGVPALLATLRDGGRRLALVSNTHSAEMVRGHLAAMRIVDAFDAVVTSIEVGYRKPRPEIFTAALEALGAEAGDAVFVGDSYDADYLGPTRMGMDAYLIVGDGLDVPAEVPASRRLGTVGDLEARLVR